MSRHPTNCVYENTSENLDNGVARLDHEKAEEEEETAAADSQEQREACNQGLLDFNISPEHVGKNLSPDIRI